MTFGRYRLERCLSQGGLGGVWLAKDLRLDRDVAVKLLPRLLVTDQGAVQRFERGARALSRLQHPNVVSLYDIGSADPGSGEEVPYLVMEFVAGQSLDDLIGNARPPVRPAVRLMIQVARAMAAAHDAGVVHRDLKPANIVVSPEGHATVLDFGLARLMRRQGQAAEATITTAGMVLGSCPYMAPEQALGQAVDNTSDIFSFGVVLYEILSGQRAFRGPNPVQVLQSVIRCDYVKLENVAPDTPQALRAIVARCMERDPERRYPDARSLVRDLDAFLHGSAEGGGSVTAEGTTGVGSSSAAGCRDGVEVGDSVIDASAVEEEGSVRLRLPSGPRRSHRSRRLVFALLTVILVWFVCECIVVIAAPSTLPPVNTLDPRVFVERYRAPITKLIDGETELFALSPKLGWSYKPWGQMGIYRSNGQGIRADRDFDAVPPDGVLRIATFGDSFMYGADVEVQDSWQARLEASDPTVEVLNFGVSAYGTDQSVLRYFEEGVRFSPQVVVLSYISENNLRNLTTFRPFYLPSTGLPFAKPRYRLEGEQLTLVGNPLPSAEDYRTFLANPEETLPRIGEHDAFYQQYESSSVGFFDRSPTFRAARFWVRRLMERFTSGADRPQVLDDWYRPLAGNNPLLFRMFDAFRDEAASHGSRPIVMLFPTHFDYQKLQQGGELSYAHVAAFLEAQNFIFIDVADIFQVYLDDGGSEEDLFAFGAEGGHFSPLGHRLIADAMSENLLAHELGAIVTNPVE